MKRLDIHIGKKYDISTLIHRMVLFIENFKSLIQKTLWSYHDGCWVRDQYKNQLYICIFVMNSLKKELREQCYLNPPKESSTQEQIQQKQYEVCALETSEQCCRKDSYMLPILCPWSEHTVLLGWHYAIN